ncbi:MAG: Cytochrome c biosis protein, partial [Jatrophihabitantaceae bacterium]|nr:Cytochrome c biosis protein [Jatrophihabitantaceae bacterium]
AALVGLVGFLSPCVLPLVPGYLSYVAGLSGQVGSEGRVEQRRMLIGALLFIAGFSFVFVTAGALFGTLGSTITEYQRQLQIVLGSITIVVGIAFLGRIPALQRERRVRWLPSTGLLGAPLLGLVFGLGWLPCLTPTLTAVYSLAATEGTAGRGAILSLAYCAGLGIPFLLVAWGAGWVTGAVGFARRHGQLISRVGGVLLVLIGILLVTGAWDHWIVQLRSRLGTGGFGAGL